MPSERERKITKYYEKIVKKWEKRYGKEALSNNQVDEIGQKYLGDKYGECIAADEFVEMPQQKDGKIYVVNTENSNQDGAHWLTFIDDKDGLLAYDSYGADIKKYNKLFRKLEFSQDRGDREQRYNNEYNCGLRALASGYVYKKFGRDDFLLI